MRAKVLGPFRLERDGENVSPPRGQVGKLLRLLLLRPNRAASTRELIRNLWPDLSLDDTEIGLRRLHVAVSRLRRFIGNDPGGLVVEQVDAGYRLVANEDALDAVAFEDQGRTALEEGDEELMQIALGRWVGEPYAGFEWSEELRIRRAALNDLRNRLLDANLERKTHMVPETLVRARHVPPRLTGPGVVLRHRLLDRLPGVGEIPAIGVVAPPGYGKSVLLSQWKDIQSAPVAWLNVTPADDDPARFWSGVTAALGQRIPVDPDRWDSVYGSSGFLDDLISMLEEWGQPLGLVLDDFDQIQSSLVQRQVEGFLSVLPTFVTVLVASRSPLPFSIARMRSAGSIFVLDGHDLRFTRDEIAVLLGEEASEWAGSIWSTTEGWPVAVRMLTSLDESDRPNGLTGSIGDYLVEEVVAKVPEWIQGFLLAISPLHSFSDDMCRYVTGREDTADCLEWLADHQLCSMVDGSDQTWMRLHPLLSAGLRSRARSSLGEEIHKIERRAAYWMLERGAYSEALGYGITGGAADVVAATAGDILLEAALEHQFLTCRRLLSRIDPEDLVGDRRAFAIAVCIASVWANHTVRSRWVQARLRHGDGEGDLVLDFVGAFDALRNGRCGLSVALFNRVIGAVTEYASEFAPDLVPFAIGISFAGLVEARMLQGDLAHDDPLFASAIAMVRPFAPPVAAYVHGWWSLVAYYDGAIDLADAMAEEHYELRRRAETDRVVRPDNSLIGAMATAKDTVDRDHLVGLARGITYAVTLQRRLEAHTAEALARIVIAAIYRKAGAIVDAAQHQERADRLILTFPDAPFLRQFAARIDRILQGGEPDDRLGLLTPREREVLTFLGTDLTTKQIATRLYMSPSTVRNHISSIYRKLQVRTRHQAVLRLRFYDQNVPPDGTR